MAGRERWPGRGQERAGLHPRWFRMCKPYRLPTLSRNPSALPLRIRCGYAATAPALTMHPIPVRLPPDLIHWLDQTRESEPRSTLIRQILRDEKRRQERADARASRQQARP
jgi:hypothetical protein